MKNIDKVLVIIVCGSFLFSGVLWLQPRSSAQGLHNKKGNFRRESPSSQHGKDSLQKSDVTVTAKLVHAGRRSFSPTERIEVKVAVENRGKSPVMWLGEGLNADYLGNL